MMFSRQISNDSVIMSKKPLNYILQSHFNHESSDASLSSAGYTNTHAVVSNVYLIQTLKILESNFNNEGQDYLLPLYKLYATRISLNGKK